MVEINWMRVDGGRAFVMLADGRRAEPGVRLEWRGDRWVVEVEDARESNVRWVSPEGEAARPAREDAVLGIDAGSWRDPDDPPFLTAGLLGAARAGILDLEVGGPAAA